MTVKNKSLSPLMADHRAELIREYRLAGCSLREISQEFDISCERVRQICIDYFGKDFLSKTRVFKPKRPYVREKMRLKNKERWIKIKENKVKVIKTAISHLGGDKVERLKQLLS